MTESKLIFITGVSGYIGSHILAEALQQGYKVRGTARGAKVAKVAKEFADFGDRVQIVDVADVGSSDVREHLKGVDFVIHTAAPLPTTNDKDAMLKGAVEGALNVIRQAYEAGVRKFVYTSSVATTGVGPDATNETWNDITEKDAQDGNAFHGYVFAKKIAEQKLWEYVDAHSDLDLISINPTMVIGPASEHQTFPSVDFTALSTSVIAWHLFDKKRRNQFPAFPGHCDVRDLARAHLGALNAPSHTVTGRKRIIFSSPLDLKWEDLIDWIVEERPSLAGRLISKDLVRKLDKHYFKTDIKRTAELTGIAEKDWTSSKKTLLDNVDFVIGLEKLWTEAGFKVDLPANPFVPDSAEIVV